METGHEEVPGSMRAVRQSIVGRLASVQDLGTDKKSGLTRDDKTPNL